MKYLISAAIALTLLGTTAPASANYFGNPRAGTNLNIGSAPNPKPVPRIVETTRVEPVAPVVAAAPVSAPAPLVVADAPPPPAPPPAVRKYIVFFDFDKSNLTMEASQVVASAVSTAKETGMV